MNLKELGKRFAMSYLLGRASGGNKKDSAVDALLGSTISQAGEDISGFTPEAAGLANQVMKDVVQGKRARKQATLKPLEATVEEVQELKDQVTNPEEGLSRYELEQEVRELQAGVTDGYMEVLKLETLLAGVLKRKS